MMVVLTVIEIEVGTTQTHGKRHAENGTIYVQHKLQLRIEIEIEVGTVRKTANNNKNNNTV